MGGYDFSDIRTGGPRRGPMKKIPNRKGEMKMNNLMPNRKALMVFVIALCLLSTLLMAAPVKADPGTTRYVPGEYLTIQAAINAANPGDTIIVAAGTYPERLTIPASKAGLTVQGDGSYPQIKPTLTTSSKYDAVITVQASDVTIRGLDISNALGVVDNPPTHIEHHGIWDGAWVKGPSGLTVDDCKFHDIEHGVRSYGDRFTVINSEFYRIGRTGVYASGPDRANGGSDNPLSMTVQYNWFHDFIGSWKENHAVHVKYRNRIGEISYNYVSGMRMGVGYYYGGPLPGYGQLVIAHNTFDLDYDLGSGPTTMTMGISLYGTGSNPSSIIIRDDIFANAKWYGIYQEGTTIEGSITVQNSLFYNNFWYYWPNSQYPFQWFGYDTRAQAGWGPEGPANAFTFPPTDITAQDPKFALTGVGPDKQWVLTCGSPAYRTASDGTNIGAWQGTLVCTVPITIASNPAGSGFVKVDDVPITTSHTFSWIPSLTHTLEALSPVGGGPGVQYVWQSWSDGGARSHTYTTAAQADTVTATYKTQYQLTISVSPPSTGTTTPAAGSYWYDSGTPVSVTATPASGYMFDSWLLDDSPAGSTNPITVTMNAPHNLVAQFLSPKVIKSNVLAELQALRADPLTTKEDGKKLDETIKHLTKSLESELWVSETRLDPKHGEKVFQEEKDAVVKLLELIKDKKSAFFESATLQGFVDRLISADRLLASGAINDAAGGDVKKIDKANEELLKGDARALDRKFVDAIEHYRNAWKHAIKAV
jgi:hypothetical protein